MFMDIKISAVIIALVGIFFLKVSIDSKVFVSDSRKNDNSKITRKAS
jgi:hypothetical protein